MAKVQLNAILSAKLADDPETLQLVLTLLQQDRCDQDHTHLCNRLIVESSTKERMATMMNERMAAMVNSTDERMTTVNSSSSTVDNMEAPAATEPLPRRSKKEVKKKRRSEQKAKKKQRKSEDTENVKKK
jgi:hypothetical protein